MKRIDELRHLVRDYGRTAVDYNRKVFDLGRDLANALNRYLGAEETAAPLVLPVPPSGDWEVEQDYGVQSFDVGQLLLLRPISMGLAVRIDNLEDAGTLWVRVAVTFQRHGQVIAIESPAGSVVRIPSDGPWDLTDACQAIFGDLEALYRADLELDRDGLYAGGRIGFRRA